MAPFFLRIYSENQSKHACFSGINLVTVLSKSSLELNELWVEKCWNGYQSYHYYYSHFNTKRDPREAWEQRVYNT